MPTCILIYILTIHIDCITVEYKLLWHSTRKATTSQIVCLQRKNAKGKYDVPYRDKV